MRTLVPPAESAENCGPEDTQGEVQFRSRLGVARHMALARQVQVVERRKHSVGWVCSADLAPPGRVVLI